MRTAPDQRQIPDERQGPRSCGVMGLLRMSKCRRGSAGRPWCRETLSGAEIRRGSEDIPGRARSHQGCTGWVQSPSSLGTTAAPRSRWLSQSRWHPAGRGQAQESQHRAAPPRTPHPEETGRKGGESELGLAGSRHGPFLLMVLPAWNPGSS